MVKNPPTNVGDLRDTGSIPGSGRFSGGCMAAHSSILAWRIPWTEVCQASVHGVEKSQTQLKRLSTHKSRVDTLKVYDL